MQTFTWTIHRTPAELYADYLAAVADANAAYLAAVADRDAAIAAARQQAQSQADALYVQYQTAMASAQVTYDAAIAAAESAYNAALASADAAWESATADARAAYEAALADAQAAYDAAIAALEADYQAALAAADEAYAAYLAPYQQARDDAYAAWQADPQNSQLEQEYNDAQAALDAAIATATAQRDDAYAAAQAARDAGAANAEAELLAAQDAAFAEYQTAIAPANAEWDEAEAAAWAVYLATKQQADDNFVVAEEAAWQDYLNGVSAIESELATAVASIAAQYDQEVTNAVAAWQAAEATAWDAYVTAMGSLPGTPPLADRVAAPPAVQLLALQQQPRVMRSDFVQVVLDNFDSWDAIRTGQTDGQLTMADIDALMRRSQFDASIENAANEAQRQAAIRRVAAIVMLRANYKFLSQLDGREDNGVTRADLNQFDRALNLQGMFNQEQLRQRRTSAITVNLDFSSTVARLTEAYNNRNTWRAVFELDERNRPLLRWENVQQGGVGDCYFVAAAVGLARARPEAIVRMIQDVGDGRYRVTFPGSQPVFVDRPTYAEMAFYSTAGSNGMWLTILCKAYGVRLNNQDWFYQPASPLERVGRGGTLSEAITALTGNRAQSHLGGVGIFGLLPLSVSKYTKAALIADIQQALLNNKVITCGTRQRLPFTRETPGQLPRSHAYTIVGYNPENQTIIIRNPWNQQAPGNRFGGTFTMTVDEFRREFAEICFER